MKRVNQILIHVHVIENRCLKKNLITTTLFPDSPVMHWFTMTNLPIKPTLITERHRKTSSWQEILENHVYF